MSSGPEALTSAEGRHALLTGYPKLRLAVKSEFGPDV